MALGDRLLANEAQDVERIFSIFFQRKGSLLSFFAEMAPMAIKDFCDKGR
jgi:hypothetical protein